MQSPESPLLVMDPNTDLCFEFVPNATATTILHLKNIHSENVAFKVKTTAPRAYLVRPNQGILRSNEAKELNIIMQPLGEHPGEVNHRFKVLAASTSLSPKATSQEVMDFWNSLSNEKIQSAKLGVKVEERAQPEPVEPDTQKADQKSEHIKSQIKDLGEFNHKLESEKGDLENQLRRIQDDLKRKEEMVKHAEETKNGGFGILHILMCFVAGMIFGYLSSVSNS
eukprot:CAMPEP_0202425526 /NCGR_PEP_ID=MMETSP1345-20130828/159_1 /ASSEMBLY_ACC=CAM_ASM_000843 /TAXON_ID=342563 /ORGANISM="Fabrea Fabrea salina" /LENGTH=224 /DNA_ID=CAMNT_0049035775 /DNA_START=370 /DNA_END=1044 /DNA_ORIENTATION=+